MTISKKLSGKYSCESVISTYLKSNVLLIDVFLGISRLFSWVVPIFFCCDNDTLFIVIELFIAKNWFNPLSVNPTKWSNTLKQFVGNLPTNCLSVFYYFVKLTLKGLRSSLPGDDLEVSISIFFTFGKLTWKLA